MALKLNTHIVIGWQRIDNPPKPDDPLRQKLAASIREWFTFRKGEVDAAMGFKDFGRMGPAGWDLLVDALDESGDQAVWSITMLSNNLQKADVGPVMSYVVQQAKAAAVRRMAMIEVVRHPHQDGPRHSLDRAWVSNMLADADPMIAAMAFVEATNEEVEANRQKVVEQLVRYFAIKDHRVLEENVKLDKTTVENANVAATRVVEQVIEKVGQANLKEVSDALTDSMIAARDTSALPIELETVRTLQILEADDQLGRLLLSSPSLSEAALTLALNHLGSGETISHASVLIGISQAARAGKWNAPERNRRRLVGSMIRYCSLGNRVPMPRDDEHALAVRRELTRWLGRPEGDLVLDALASRPRPEEEAIYVAGLKSHTLDDAADCIRALKGISSRTALDALVGVFDRGDALEDMYAQARNSRGQLAASVPLPPHKASLAYLADDALTFITGGAAESVPAYDSAAVLQRRREYWRSVTR
jgi:hypothetical protein